MRLLGIVVATALCNLSIAAEPTVVDLWPDKPPGFQVEGGPERDTTGPDGRGVAGRRVIRLGDVSKPQLHIYQPEEGKRNGTAVVICPGGGFNILAWDLEGTEVAEWLNSLGVTAAVLKYRVPTRNADPNWLPPTQDAQRALSLIRAHADEWQVDPKRIGILGFSAGGRTAAMATVNPSKRLYDKIDSTDEAAHRPDFTVLVYPAYLVDDAGKLLPEVTVTRETPPTFLVHAYDDGVTPKSSVQFFLACKDVGVPAELHIYDTGGHGYGLRQTEMPVTRWSERCAEWMKSRGLLTSKLAAEEAADAPTEARRRIDRSKIWNAIVHEHVESSNEFLRLQRAAKSDEESASIARQRHEKAYELSRRALVLAEPELTDDRSDDPLGWFATTHILTNPHDAATGQRAAELAVDLHRERLPELCRTLAWGITPSAAGETVFNAVVKDSDPKTRIPASVHFAEYLRRRSELAKQVHFLPAYASDLAQEYGRDYADHLSRRDGDRDALKAEELLEYALTKHADLLAAEEFSDRSLADVARERLHVLRDLAIGKIAPVIDGSDVSGRRFDSSDYDGKVRVLYFWGHWCVGCRSMYPKATAMGETFRDEPFAFLGVNSDKDPKLVAKLVDDGTLTFPVWFDGGQGGPIGKEWAIYGAPHAYVVDAEGMIRWKSTKRLNEVVRKLIDESTLKQ